MGGICCARLRPPHWEQFRVKDQRQTIVNIETSTMEVKGTAGPQHKRKTTGPAEKFLPAEVEAGRQQGAPEPQSASSTCWTWRQEPAGAGLVRLQQNIQGSTPTRPLAYGCLSKAIKVPGTINSPEALPFLMWQIGWHGCQWPSLLAIVQKKGF